MTIVLSFDVGVIHLAYCLITKKDDKWDIIDWGNIDLTHRDEQKCYCGANAKLYNTEEGIIKYYCKTHGKKINIVSKIFEECFKECTNTQLCMHQINSINDEKICGKKAKFINQNLTYCNTHAKQLHKCEVKAVMLKPFKIKSSTTLNFDDIKYNLIMELEKRVNLLTANYVVIENQPSFKNPRMKSIASTLYDYYLIRGVVDKNITKSNILQVKFISPSNKLKLASEGDTKQLIKVKNTNESKSYKLTKSLGIKYCSEMIIHLENWLNYFNSHNKKDDLADAFLQGVYFYSNNL
jgi:hypothetical protein